MAHLDIMTGPNYQENLGVFAASREFTGQIEDQNARFEQVQEIFKGDEEIRDIASDGIAEEQSETFAQLRDLTNENARVFTGLGQFSLDLLREVQVTAEDMTDHVELIELGERELAAKKEEKQAEILKEARAIVDSVAQLAPRALDRVNELLQARISQSISDPEMADLEKQLADLNQYLETLKSDYDALESHSSNVDDMLTEHGAAWPVPLALAHNREKLAVVQAFIDELPVEPELTARSHDRFEDIKSRYVDQPLATLYASLYLTERPNHTVTVDDLINFLYSTEAVESVSRHNMRSRVTTILGPERGTAVRGILNEEGLILQYGWRKYIERVGDGMAKIVSRQRIYRAIPFDALTEDLVAPDQGEGFEDEFETTPNIRALQNDRAIVGLALKNLGLLAPGETVKDIPFITVALDEVESDIQAGEELVPILGSALATAKQLGEPEPPKVIEEPCETVHGSEMEQYKARIERAIIELAQVGLMESPEGVSLSTARIKNDTKLWGRMRHFQRLKAAGLIEGNFDDQDASLAYQMVDPVSMVLLKLVSSSDLVQNPHRGAILRHVKKMVATHFEEQQKAAAAAKTD
jgi:hypothetical protein